MVEGLVLINVFDGVPAGRWARGDGASNAGNEGDFRGARWTSLILTLKLIRRLTTRVVIVISSL